MTAENAAKQNKYTDIVGIEVGGASTRLVRLVRRKDDIEIAGVGDLHSIRLPESSSDPFERTLSVPKALAAPYAAFALESALCVLRLVTLKRPPEVDEEAAVSELFGSAPPQDYRIGFAPVGSAGSERTYLACGLPDYLALAVASLLPEGRRPAPASLQVAEEARLNAFALGPARRHADECVVHIQVRDSSTSVAVFNKGHLAAYRQFPIGNGGVVEEVARQFGLAQELAGELLCENQIDTTSATKPVLMPLFRQIGLSSEFVARRESCQFSRIFVSGEIAGLPHWLQMAESTFSAEARAWSPMEDHPRQTRVAPCTSASLEQPYHAALGAALALMEGE